MWGSVVSRGKALCFETENEQVFQHLVIYWLLFIEFKIKNNYLLFLYLREELIETNILFFV